MIHKIRQLLFITSFILFIILTPLILLHTWGFRWNWQEKKFVQTGAIILQSTPSKTDIYFNGQIQKKRMLPNIEGLKSFIGFNGLIPGDYEVLLRKDGYHPWKKRLKIEPGLVTKAENILLLPKRPTLKKLSSNNVENFIFSPDRKKIAYSESDKEKAGIWIVNLEDKNETQIITENSWGLSHTQNYSGFEWSWNSQKLLFAGIVGNRKKWFVIDIRKPSELIDLTDLVSFPNDEISADDFRWHPHNNEKIFYLKEGSLWQVNYLNKTTNDLNINNVLGWTIEQNTLYWIQGPAGILYKASLDGKNKKQVTLNPLPNISQGIKQKIITSPKERFAILDSKGMLYLIDETDKPISIEEKVLMAEFSQDSKKLLYQTENEIWVLYLKNKETQPEKKKGEKELITRFSEKISQSIWYPDFEHIFFVVGNKIKCIELDDRDQRNVIDFIETKKENQKIFCDAKTKKLYFTDEKDGTRSLYEAELPR